MGEEELWDGRGNELIHTFEVYGLGTRLEGVCLHGTVRLILCVSGAGALLEESGPSSDDEGPSVLVCSVPEGGQPTDPVPPPEWSHEGSGFPHLPR